MISFSLPYFEKLISFNIKNLELYIKQDSSNKLKGVIYGMASTCRHNSGGILLKSVKFSKKISFDCGMVLDARA
jgi:hypothetical protein